MISREQIRVFSSDEISPVEFKKILSEVVEKTHPENKVENFNVNKDGLVEVSLDNGETIEIEVDWDEVILKEGKR